MLIHIIYDLYHDPYLCQPAGNLTPVKKKNIIINIIFSKEIYVQICLNLQFVIILILIQFEKKNKIIMI